MHRDELEKIFGKIKEKGLSCVPLKIFFKKGLVKLDIALVRGKKLHDKRETIKNREASKKLKNDLRR